MECLKCGRETDQTFCEECRRVMAEYPVEPGLAIQLPKREDPARRMAKRKTQASPEAQIAQLKGIIRRLILWMIAMVMVIAVLCAGCFLLYKRSKLPLLGQNYSTVTQPTETIPETE